MPIRERFAQKQFHWDARRLRTALGVAGTGGGTLHPLLGAVHTDTEIVTPPDEGSLVLANSDFLWDVLLHNDTAGCAMVSSASTWTMDQTPTWTGDHTWDDGAGNSPSAVFVGASDDEGKIYLRNSATPGDSDLVARLCADDDDSRFEIRNLSGTLMGYVSALGNLWIQEDFYLTTTDGIIHADGNTAGWVLRGNGTKYVPGQVTMDDVTGGDAEFVVMSLSANLSNERVLTGGDSLTLTDGGANGNATLDLDTPGTLTVATANNAAAPHLHTITSSSNPGAAASILASAADGGLQLIRLGIGVDPNADNLIRMTDDAAIGLSSATGRIVFNETGTDAIEITSADLEIATTTYGITHVDGVADGQYLRANGTRYVPSTIQAGDVPALTASFLTLGLSGDLSAERVFVDGDSLTGVDGGANGNYTLNLDTPGTLTVATANNATAPHLHTVTSSSNPGVAASLLATDANGDLGVQDLTLAEYLVHGGDTDTYMRFQADNITLYAGNVAMIDIVEAGTDYVSFGSQVRLEGNPLYIDVDDDTYIHDSADDTIQFVLNSNAQYTYTATQLTLADTGGTNRLWIRTHGDVANTGADIYSQAALGLAADEGIYLLIDGDNNQSNAGVFVMNNAETSSGASEILRIQENARVGINNNNPLTMLHIDQSSSTGGIQVLYLDQADVDQAFIKFVGTAAAGVLGNSIVDEGDQSSETRAGWLKVFVQDDGNEIVDQSYFIPIYVLS